MSYIGNIPTTAAFVTDQFSANGSGTVFTLSTAPANTSSILVAVSGVLQDPTTYSVAATTLTFSAAPPAGTGNISVRFLGIPASGVTTTAYRTVTEFTATAGQTTFTPPSYTVGYISVYRNGVMLGTSDFTATSGTTVVLATGATAGDLITTESFYVSSVLNAIPATNGAVTSAYLLDGSVTQAKLGTNVAGNGPVFAAAPTLSTTLTTATNTKITFNQELFDTNNCFDTTNYRFTPNVAGYYQLSFFGQCDYCPSGRVLVFLYKNGAQSLAVEQNLNAPSSTYPALTLNALVYANGTDYFEIYARQESGSSKTVYGTGGTTYPTYWSGSLVRSA